MRLKSLEYSEKVGEPEEWTLTGLSLSEINLLVGKNASGKSRILNIIHALAQAISEQRRLDSGKYKVIFGNDSSTLEYVLEFQESRVIQEVFTVNDKTKLERSSGGAGKIFAVKLNTDIDFQTPDDQLAVAVRRDSIQHPYFEPLHQWAKSLYYYPFSTTLGKERFAIFIKGDQKSEVNPKDPSQVIAIYDKGKRDFGDRFTEAVKTDFESIGYPINEVGIAAPRSIKIQGTLPGEFSGLYVQESDLPGITDQHAMSAGMFRALSIIVQVNYSVLLADTPSCILIDDIGEGLDFERSCALIDVLTSKARNSSVQLLMATNDRFVMNRVPLEYWSLVDRKSNRVEIRNYSNSKDIFDKFKFTGLNNFDFLAFDYLHEDASNE